MTSSLFVASNAPHPLSPVRRDRISKETSHASENTAVEVAQISFTQEPQHRAPPFRFKPCHHPLQERIHEGRRFFVPADVCARTRLQLNVCCLCIVISEGRFFFKPVGKKHATQSDFVAVDFGGSVCQKNTSVAERSHRQSFILVHMICCDATVDFDLAVNAQNP